MEAFIFTLLCILWFISGAASFVYWWTKESDFTWDHVPLMVVGGICGPLTFLVGWCVHGNGLFKNKGGVLFKKREKSS